MLGFKSAKDCLHGPTLKVFQETAKLHKQRQQRNETGHAEP